MKFAVGLLVLIPLALCKDYQVKGLRSKNHHTNSLDFHDFVLGGCRKRHPENRSLPGGAEACHSHKPLKIKGMEKLGKRLCSDGYEYCSVSHKSLHRLSWKPEIMPRSCFAFHYKKNKFAGYGHNCHRNQYFDGLLCCPIQTEKTANHFRIKTNSIQKRHLAQH